MRKGGTSSMKYKPRTLSPVLDEEHKRKELSFISLYQSDGGFSSVECSRI